MGPAGLKFAAMVIVNYCKSYCAARGAGNDRAFDCLRDAERWILSALH